MATGDLIAVAQGRGVVAFTGLASKIQKKLRDGKLSRDQILDEATAEIRQRLNRAADLVERMNEPDGAADLRQQAADAGARARQLLDALRAPAKG